MLKLKVINCVRHHFIVSGDEPFRIEVTTAPDGVAQAMVYRGVEVDGTQEPDLVYDGTLDQNVSVISLRKGHSSKM